MAAAMLVAVFLAGLTVLSVSAHAESPGASAVPAAAESAELEKRLAVIESAIEEKRKSLGVQGASLVIVRDGRIVFAKGFGLRDAERNLRVTPETLFAIGSASKSFTAMAAAMAADVAYCILLFARDASPEAEKKTNDQSREPYREG
jgi:CubicO group peptidase (beta-lactamase class C family)